MTKIVVTNNQDFTEEQKQRLDDLGDVTYYDTLPESGEEYLEREKVLMLYAQVPLACRTHMLN